MTAHSDRFAEQGLLFDARAGLDPAVGDRVARSVAAHTAGSPEDLIVEIGAGTGEIGRDFAALPLTYVGIDLSRPMLTVFQEKVGGMPVPALIQADGNCPWPVRESGSARWCTGTAPPE